MMSNDTAGRPQDGTGSERKTGNEPVSGTDPGGTRPAPANHGAGADGREAGHKVGSGDRNDMTVSDPLKDK